MDRLRIATDVDLPEMLLWRNNPQVRSAMYTQHVISIEEHHAWWETQKDRNDCRHLIYEQNGQKAGVVSFSGIDAQNGTADWAFYARLPSPPGIGRSMEALAIDYAFTVLKLRKLSCEVLLYNKKVIALHKSFGFRIEGILREHRMIGDHYETVIRLAMFARRWTTLGSDRTQ